MDYQFKMKQGVKISLIQMAELYTLVRHSQKNPKLHRENITKKRYWGKQGTYVYSINNGRELFTLLNVDQPKEDKNGKTTA